MTSHIHRLVPDCKVSLNGTKLSVDLDAMMTKVDVDLDADLFGQCVLTFTDPHLKLIDGKDFECGTAVKVEIGFHTGLSQVFEGEVVRLEPQFRRDLPPALKVVAVESLHKLALSHKTRSYMDVDDLDIVTIIAQENGMTADAPTGTKEHVLQSNTTDADFLRRLAAKHGNTVRITGKTIVIGPPEKLDPIDLGPANGIRKMNVKFAATGQVSEVSVHGWDPKTKQEIIGKASPEGDTGKGAQDFGKGTLSMASHHAAPADTATAEAMAKGRLRKIAEGYAQAQGEMIGDPDVIPGSILNFDKLGEKVDGQYRVTHANHAFSKHGYYVRFSAVWVGPKKPPAGLKNGKGGADGLDRDGDGDGRGDRDNRNGEGGRGDDQLDRPDLENLQWGYRDGKSLDKDVDADWRKHEHEKDLKDLEFSYRRGWGDGTDQDPQFDDTKPPQLEDLEFRYRANYGMTQEQIDDAQQAERLPDLADLELDYAGGDPSDDDE